MSRESPLGHVGLLLLLPVPLVLQGCPCSVAPCCDGCPTSGRHPAAACPAEPLPPLPAPCLCTLSPSPCAHTPRAGPPLPSSPFPGPACCLPADWIVWVDDDYELAVVSGGPPTFPSNGKCTTGTNTVLDSISINGVGLWLFSRSQTVTDAQLAKLRGEAERLGFDISVLKTVAQAGCMYDDA